MKPISIAIIMASLIAGPSIHATNIDCSIQIKDTAKEILLHQQTELVEYTVPIEATSRQPQSIEIFTDVKATMRNKSSIPFMFFLEEKQGTNDLSLGVFRWNSYAENKRQLVYESKGDVFDGDGLNISFEHKALRAARVDISCAKSHFSSPF